MKVRRPKARPKAAKAKKAASRPGLGLPRLPFPFFRWGKVNLPNQLTLMRMLGLPIFIALFLSDNVAAQWGGLAFFGGLAFTDWLDGYIARSRGLITNFGKIMDPLADKLLMLTAMICLVQVGAVPGFMIVLIWWRELAVTGLRTLVAMKARALAADTWGKVKTVMQVVAVVGGMLSYTLQNTLNFVADDWRPKLEGAGWGGDLLARALDTNAVAYWFMFAAAIISVWSGIRYFRKNWELVCEELEDAERVES